MTHSLDRQTWLGHAKHAVCRSKTRVTSASMVRMNAEMRCLELQVGTGNITADVFGDILPGLCGPPALTFLLH